jgi:hypothetical protein
MRSTGEVGLKIGASQREYFRYSGESAEAERRGVGCSLPELAWARRVKREAKELDSAVPAKEIDQV